MNIADKSVVFMHYTLTDDQGQTIDTSAGREPMPYLHGANN
nr:peptidylprolyl isomerase [Candidatus Krumholzibacteria bacterium]